VRHNIHRARRRAVSRLVRRAAIRSRGCRPYRWSVERYAKLDYARPTIQKLAYFVQSRCGSQAALYEAIPGCYADQLRHVL